MMVICCDVVVEIWASSELARFKGKHSCEIGQGRWAEGGKCAGVCALFCEWGRQFSTSEGITDGEMEHE